MPLSSMCFFGVFKKKMNGLIKLIRPRQWIKNMFVLAPLIFSGEFLNIDYVGKAFVAMCLFCVASSAAYIVNDIFDVNRDRLHPKKMKSRPLASGEVSVKEAIILLLILYIVLIVGWHYASQILSIMALYLIMNFLYTFSLKRAPVVDIFIIAIGFVMRVYVGTVALELPVSSWMLITTLCLALFLASVKRRQELCQSGSEGRDVLEKYTIPLVDRYAEMSAIGALMFYSMFVMSTRPVLAVTVPMVLFGLFRYWYVVEIHEEGESPTDALLLDWPLLVTVIAWGVSCGLILWPMSAGVQ